MDFVRVTPGRTAARPGCAVAIGNFDGVHLGHQALVRRAVARATEAGLAAAVLTFEPMPLEYLRPESAPARLMHLRDKALALAGLGVERLCVARFDARLRAMTASQFEQLLHADLSARSVTVGHGFRYGAGRCGDVDTLIAAGRRHGYAVEVIEAVVCRGGERVSSTRVRAALAAGALDEAQGLLGRPYAISGRVVHGQALGRTLGFPTANLRLARSRVPLSGIYAVHAEVRGRRFAGVASLGTRPTVGGVEPLLETHLFDYAGNLYGAQLRVEFVAKLRDEARFDGLDALIAQMHRDAAAARAILAFPARAAR